MEKVDQEVDTVVDYGKEVGDVPDIFRNRIFTKHTYRMHCIQHQQDSIHRLAKNNKSNLCYSFAVKEVVKISILLFPSRFTLW